MRILLTFMLTLFCATSFARIDLKCLVRYSYNCPDENQMSFTHKTSEAKEVTVSFVSGAEMKPIRPAVEKYAVVWFSQKNCAVILLKPKRTTYVQELKLNDMYDVVSSGQVFGEQVNGETDALNMPYQWIINLRDSRRGYDFVDPRLRELNERTGYGLYDL